MASKSGDEYTVGWVTALPLELAAATAMLDEEHEPPRDFVQPSTDPNTYTWGCVGEHNVVIASLPAGVYGTTSAATTASAMLFSFPNIRIKLMVGIGAGIPEKHYDPSAEELDDYDIRLGDIVVSQPSGRSGGVVQYDLGKVKQSGQFERSGSLSAPPQALLTALAKLQAQHERLPSQVSRILKEMQENNAMMARRYRYQGEQNDRLFEANYIHIGGSSCQGCDPQREIQRPPRASTEPRIHYGVIASGNSLVKDGLIRDAVVQEIGEECICFEMEAAGLMNNFPCLVIRGICDYADSHKNDQWQRYAAAAAAAYAKELLLTVPKVSVLQTCVVADRSGKTAQELILNALNFEAMDERYHDVARQEEDTFEWIFEDDAGRKRKRSSVDEGEELSASRQTPFKTWLASGSGIFHISGKPGSGKSTLMKFLWRHEQTTQLLENWAEAHNRHLVVAQHFFWKPGSRLQKSLAGLLRTLLFHVLQQLPGLIDIVFPNQRHPSVRPYLKEVSTGTISDDEVVDAFDRLVRQSNIYTTHCFCFFIDGLDEFEEKRLTHGALVNRLQQLVSASAGAIKLCVSSREFSVFQERLPSSQRIRLQDLTRGDINGVVQQKLNNEVHFQRLLRRNPEGCRDLVNDIVDKSDGVFLWVALSLKLLCEALESRYTLSQLFQKLEAIPTELSDFYRYMLESIPEHDRTEAFCLLSMTNKINEAILDDEYFTHFGLFMASFVSDWLANPEFASNRSLQNMTDQKIGERLADAAAQSTSCCKGLLEVREAYPFRGGLIFKDELKFIHRSVPEFWKDFAELDSTKYLNNIDIIDGLIQSFLAVIKSIAPEDFVYLPNIDESAEVLLINVRDSGATSQRQYFDSLDKIDMALQYKQLQRWPEVVETGWNKFFIFWPARYHTYDCLSLSHVACRTLFHEYIEWTLNHKGWSHMVQDTGNIWLLHSVLDGMNCEHVVDGIECDPERTKKTLELVFGQGADPNADLKEPSARPRSPYSRLFSIRINWAGLEIFLKFGAYRPLWVCSNVLGDERLKIRMRYGKDESAVVYTLTSVPEDFPPCLHRKGGMARLQDWIEYEKPNNSEAISALLEDDDDTQIEELLESLLDAPSPRR